MLRNGLLSIIVGLTLVVGACGGGGGGEQQDAGVQDDAAAQFDRGQSDQGGQDDATVGDNDNSFETAGTIAYTDTSGKKGVINPAGDRDYWKFQGTAGDWVWISIDANPDGVTTMVDTVITVYDSAHNQVAQDDDAVPRTGTTGSSTDSEVIMRLPATGTYYVMVQEYSDWNDPPAVGKATYTYTLYVINFADIDPTAAGLTFDPETGDAVANAAPLVTLTDSAAVLFGTLRDGSDKDVYSFTATGSVDQAYNFSFMPHGSVCTPSVEGAAGYGSSTPAGNIYVTDATGATVIARVDNSAGPTELGPSLAPGNYLLWVEAPTTAIGANPFYVAKHYAGQENTAETEGATATGANDTTAAAETITMAASGSAGWNGGYILAHLQGINDVDVFKFNVNAGDVMSVACGAARQGSNVRGLKAELLDSSGNLITGASVTETLAEDLIVGEYPNYIAAPAAGTIYLRLTATAASDATVTSNFIRCGVHAGPPSA
jgi:hypothetical protein